MLSKATVFFFLESIYSRYMMSTITCGHFLDSLRAHIIATIFFFLTGNTSHCRQEASRHILFLTVWRQTFHMNSYPKRPATRIHFAPSSTLDVKQADPRVSPIDLATLLLQRVLVPWPSQVCLRSAAAPGSTSPMDTTVTSLHKMLVQRPAAKHPCMMLLMASPRRQ